MYSGKRCLVDVGRTTQEVSSEYYVELSGCVVYISYGHTALGVRICDVKKR